MSEQYDRLRQLVSRYHAELQLDDEGHVKNAAVTRPNLGEESTEKEIGSVLENVGLYLRIFHMFGAEVSDQVLANVADATVELLNSANSFARMNNQDYIRNKAQLVIAVNGAADHIRAHIFHPVAVGVLRQRLLEHDLNKRYAEAESTIAKTIADVESKFRKELDERTSAAREYFDRREEELKRSAFKVSVEAAQDQFREAGTYYDSQVRFWSLVVVLTVVTFGAFGVYLMVNVHPPTTLAVIYFAAVRIVLLSALGAVATFCLRVLRANLHMRAHNAHRLRVANSVAAFVEAARTNEQSDQILAHLVTAVATFGNTGLVEGGEDRPIVPIEAISKVLVERAK